MAVREALAAGFSELSADEAIRVLILTGGPDVFVGGADVRDFLDADATTMVKRRGHRFWEAIAASPKIVVAAVNGAALGGGCELAMCADIIIAGRRAKFGQPEIKLGLIPGAGGTQKLLRNIGRAKTALLVLTGRIISGEQAEAMGIASEVVDDADVQEHALQLAAEIASMPPLALGHIKELLTLGGDASLATALALERRTFELMFATSDKTEGISAFLEKRDPVWLGK
jgi:enoyl-CoA hydratase/carnithine racemase